MTCANLANQQHFQVYAPRQMAKAKTSLLQRSLWRRQDYTKKLEFPCFSLWYLSSWPNSPQWTGASSLSKLHDHTRYSVRLRLKQRQQKTLTRNKHLCPRRDSNPQPQQASGYRPTPFCMMCRLRNNAELKQASNSDPTLASNFLPMPR
jgi:hypothetical protein